MTQAGPNPKLVEQQPSNNRAIQPLIRIQSSRTYDISPSPWLGGKDEGRESKPSRVKDLRTLTPSSLIDFKTKDKSTKFKKRLTSYYDAFRKFAVGGKLN